ncbi:MAG TPA: hypothetical protein VNF26_07775 [Candidatus Baltobacterales bacterium]|nr:hypothetical protein [Candidatus Baltobacterales bacterium]
MNDFERELEDELHRILDPMTAVPIPRRRVPESGGAMKKLLGGAGAAIGLKVLTGVAVAAAAATFAVAATEVATTGSLNPLNWGQQVTQQVNACKVSAERLGVHGIGQCVASFARTHGKAVSASHKPTNPGDNGNGHANGHAKDKGNGHGNSSGHGANGTAGNSGVTPPKVTTEPPVTQSS